MGYFETYLAILNRGQITKTVPLCPSCYTTPSGEHLTLDVGFDVYQNDLHGVFLVKSGFEPVPKPKLYHRTNTVFCSPLELASVGATFSKYSSSTSVIKIYLLLEVQGHSVIIVESGPWGRRVACSDSTPGKIRRVYGSGAC
ncbi:hypothetical protein AVEN_136449-1 [Araneus ventricosus]|uniref:Uncharacterized protein n=1 Tax=Araneus ventricosus TaxID=182803 RepID=A0A4Y2X2R7_ARAVE|nr:hypothetical protein AVEN_136449-1 [Araneus ventricosus]